jgi:hypothetical protein
VMIEVAKKYGDGKMASVNRASPPTGVGPTLARDYTIKAYQPLQHNSCRQDIRRTSRSTDVSLWKQKSPENSFETRILFT